MFPTFLYLQPFLLTSSKLTIKISVDPTPQRHAQEQRTQHGRAWISISWAAHCLASLRRPATIAHIGRCPTQRTLTASCSKSVLETCFTTGLVPLRKSRTFLLKLSAVAALQHAGPEKTDVLLQLHSCSCLTVLALARFASGKRAENTQNKCRS